MLISGCSTKYWTPWPLLQYLLEGFCRLLVLVHLHFFISQIGDCDPKDYLGHLRSRIVLTYATRILYRECNCPFGGFAKFPWAHLLFETAS